MSVVANYRLDILHKWGQYIYDFEMTVGNLNVLFYNGRFGPNNLCSLFFECDYHKIDERLEEDPEQDMMPLFYLYTCRILRNSRLRELKPKEGIILPIRIKNNTIAHFYNEYNHQGIRPDDLNDVFDPLWRFLHISWIPDKK